MAITPLPTPPSRTSPGTFSERTDAFLGALPGFVAQINSLATEVENNATTAAAAVGYASDAEAAAVAAAASSSATRWVSGSTYEQGDVVWSPLNLETYRRKSDGAGTIDPSQDPDNWQPDVQLKTINSIPIRGSGNIQVVAAFDITYDNRGDLRTLPDLTAIVLVDSIGLFRHVTGSTEPDDDETCFATATGRWLLECPNWNYIEAQIPVNNDVYMYLKVPNTITAVATVSVVTIDVAVYGASPGMPVLVTPPGALDGRITVTGYVANYGTVRIAVGNPSAGTSATLPTGNWVITIFNN
jgi:hypothetical protein